MDRFLALKNIAFGGGGGGPRGSGVWTPMITNSDYWHITDLQPAINFCVMQGFF